MSSFPLIHFFIFIFILNNHFCRTDYGFGYGDPTDTKLSKRNSTNTFRNSMRFVRNLTGPRPDLSFSKDLPIISGHRTATTNARTATPLTGSPLLGESPSRENVSSIDANTSSYRKRRHSVLVEVLQSKKGNKKPPRKILIETEQFKNRDFEHNLHGWSCYYCWAKRVPGGYRSKYAAKITNKDKRLGSMRTTIKVKHGLYYYTSYVKLLNPTKTNILYVYVMTLAKIFRYNRTDYEKVGETLRVQPDTRWYKIGGDVYVPKDATSMQVYINVKNAKMQHLFDQASCTRVDPVPNWKEEMNLRIEEIRKANIEVRLKNVHLLKSYKLKILQKTDEFKWGAAVKTWLINNSGYGKYCDFIYKNFNWAVIENGLKWANNEPHRGNINLVKAKRTVAHLLENNVHVRGHVLFYGSTDPSWVKHLRGEELLKALKSRVQNVMGPFKNKVSIWDVSNENLRNSMYENLLNDPNITQKMFLMAHKEDPHAKLYFNENMVVKSSFGTVALEDRANMYQDAGIPLHGIGVQSHMTGNFNVFVIMRRLNEIAKAGLPIFISELTYEGKNVSQRVASYEKLLRIYYSHPAVEGVMFWTIWSNGWRPTAEMLDRHFAVNEVGKLYLALKAEWSTSPIEYDLSKLSRNFSVFLGEYQVRLVKSGQTVWKKTLHIDDPNSTTTLVIGRGSQ